MLFLKFLIDRLNNTAQVTSQQCDHMDDLVKKFLPAGFSLSQLMEKFSVMFNRTSREASQVANIFHSVG